SSSGAVPMVSLHESSSIGGPAADRRQPYATSQGACPAPMVVLYNEWRSPITSLAFCGRGGRPWSTTVSVTARSRKRVMSATDSDTEAEAVPQLSAGLLAWIV